MQRRTYLTALLSGIVLIGAGAALFQPKPMVVQAQTSTAVFTPDGKLKIPEGFRRWVFVGAPLTPNGLNGGQANFPEFHNVYIQAENIEAYMKTGEFPEGTVIVKELTRLLNSTFPDGSRFEPSGRGFFNGAFNGIDLTVKDSKRFAKTNGWGFFTFGHHPLPYDQTAAEAPATVCANCHMANVAKTDMTWVQFYPMLLNRAEKTRWDTPQSR
ncbi:MAG: cytochrome P460 family protein [Paludibaculum sp.]